MASKTSLPGILKRAVSPLSTNSNLSSSIALSYSFAPAVEFVVLEMAKLGTNIKSFRVPLERAVREVMVPSIRRNFDEGGRPSWDPLADATIFLREFYGYGTNPLIKTGRLRRVASQINMWDVTSMDATMKELPEKVWYGRIQNDGTGNNATSAKHEVFKPIRTPDQIRAEGRKIKTSFYDRQTKLLDALTFNKSLKQTEAKKEAWIPARPFMVIQPEDELAIIAIYEAWLDERVMAVRF